MSKHVETYSKPQPVALARLLWVVGGLSVGGGLYFMAAAIATRTADNVVVNHMPAPSQFYTPLPAPQPAPQPVMQPAPRPALQVAMQSAPQPAMQPAPQPTPVAPAGASEQERFEAARAQIVAVLQHGPNFGGTAFVEGQGETVVRAHLVWDDVTKRASGHVSFLTFNTQADFDGTVTEDRTHPGQIVLQLKARTTDCFYYLTPTSSGQLSGNWKWGYGRESGTIILDPKGNEMADADASTPPLMQTRAMQTASVQSATPAAAQPTAPVPMAVPAGTLIDVENTEVIDPTQSRTWRGRTTDGFDLNNGKTVDAGTEVILRLVKNGQNVGIQLEGVRVENRMLAVKTDVLPLNVKAANNVVTQNGNTTTVNLGGFISSLGNHVARNTPFTFTVSK